MHKPAPVKLALLLIFYIVLLLFPAGCYDRRELDEMAYVVAIGFDRGVTDKLRLTLQILTFAGGEEGGGGGMAGTDGGGDKEKGLVDGTAVVTVDCPSLFTGLNTANIATSRQLNLMHAKMVVVSEELARSGEIEKYISAIVRYREIRRIMNIAVTRGTAEEFIKENKTLLGKNPAKAMDLLQEQRKYTGFYPRERFLEFYNDYKSNEEQPVVVLVNVNQFKNLPGPEQGQPQEGVSGGNYLAGDVPRKGGAKREYFGAAVFRGAKMVGELTGDEARVLGMVRGEFTSAFFTIKDPMAPGYVVPLDVRPARKPEIKVNIKDGTPEIDVKIRLEGETLAIQSRTHYEKPDLKPILEAAFGQEIKNQLDSLLEKCQREFRSDIFGFGRHAVGKFPTIEQWEEYRWLERFPEARVSTDVEFKIRRTGMMLNSSPILSEEEGME